MCLWNEESFKFFLNYNLQLLENKLLCLAALPRDTALYKKQKEKILHKYNISFIYVIIIFCHKE